jgi:Flp pilus assembly protein TadG
LSINANGNVFCREGSANITCSLTITNPATGAFTWTDSINNSATSTVTGILNFLTGGVSGTFTDTMSQPATGSIVGQRR